MIFKSPIALLSALLILGYFGNAFGNDTQSEDIESKEDSALIANIEAGEERYNHTCINCHGTAGKGVASFPKIPGKEIMYTKTKLETYREGIKIGPNSSLMIMMAKPLTDEEITNLAAYLEQATH